MSRFIVAVMLLLACWACGSEPPVDSGVDTNDTLTFLDSDDALTFSVDAALDFSIDDDPNMTICTACNEDGHCVTYPPAYQETEFSYSMMPCWMPLVGLVVDLCQAGELPDGFDCK